MKDIKKRYIDLINHYDPFCDLSEHATLTPSEMLYNLIEIRKNNFDCIESDDIELVNKFDSLIDYMKSKGIEPGYEIESTNEGLKMNEFTRNYMVLKEILTNIDRDTTSFLEGDEEALSSELIIEYKGTKARIPLDYASINQAAEGGLQNIIESIEADLIEDNKNINIEFEEIESIYTGGGIWNFLGKLSNGNYFFASDLNDDFIELDEDPRATEDYSYWEWLAPHSVHIYNDNETAPIFIELFKWLESHGNNDFDFQAEIESRREA